MHTRTQTFMRTSRAQYNTEIRKRCRARRKERRLPIEHPPRLLTSPSRCSTERQMEERISKSDDSRLSLQLYLERSHAKKNNDAYTHADMHALPARYTTEIMKRCRAHQEESWQLSRQLPNLLTSASGRNATPATQSQDVDLLSAWACNTERRMG